MTVQRKLAVEHHSDAFKCVQDYKAKMEKLSGFPVRFEETDSRTCWEQQSKWLGNMGAIIT